jgi:hypothetical protein
MERLGLVLTGLAALIVLAGCASTMGMNHAHMSREEMMRHCEMMAQHAVSGEHDPAHHDAERHGGMSHEEMERQCATMRETPDSSAAPHQH